MKKNVNKLVDSLVDFFSKPREKTKDKSPEGLCPVCWGYQQYDGKVRDLFKDRQVDVNNKQDSYLIIQEFVKDNIEGIRLKEGETDVCPDCGCEECSD